MSSPLEVTIKLENWVPELFGNVCKAIVKTPGINKETAEKIINAVLQTAIHEGISVSK